MKQATRAWEHIDTPVIAQERKQVAETGERLTEEDMTGKELLKESVKRVLPAALSMCMIVPTRAAVSYLPDVTPSMARPGYWSGLQQDAGEVLLSMEEIQQANEAFCRTPETMMYNLREEPETFDALELREALAKGARADAGYYLGWTYGSGGSRLNQAYFDRLIENGRDPNARAAQPLRYAVASRHTVLRTFPTRDAILGNPSDTDFDYQSLTAIRINEPMTIYAESADGAFYMVHTACCSGWVSKADVAVCRDRAEWLDAWDIPPEEVLVVTGDKVYTEASNTSPVVSERLLGQGAVFRSVRVENPNELIHNRAAYYNYVIYLPVRNEDGSYAKTKALISMHANVSEGYLPLTKANIAAVTFETLGNAYGWGGMLHTNDCSGVVRDIYKCFGLELPRNGNWQSKMPAAKLDLREKTVAEREALLDTLPLGTALMFNGHEMLYLGKAEGKYYVYSTVSTIRTPGGDGSQKIRGFVVNALDTKRVNGKTWLEELHTAIVPYYPLLDGKSYPLAGYTEPYHAPSAADGETLSRAQLVQALGTLTEKLDAKDEQALRQAAEKLFQDSPDGFRKRAAFSALLQGSGESTANGLGAYRGLAQLALQAARNVCAVEHSGA